MKMNSIEEYSKLLMKSVALKYDLKAEFAYEDGHVACTISDGRFSIKSYGRKTVRQAAKSMVKDEIIYSRPELDDSKSMTFWRHIRGFIYDLRYAFDLCSWKVDPRSVEAIADTLYMLNLI